MSATLLPSLWDVQWPFFEPVQNLTFLDEKNIGVEFLPKKKIIYIFTIKSTT